MCLTNFYYQEWSCGSNGYLTDSQQRSKRQVKEAAKKMASAMPPSSSVSSSSDLPEVSLIYQLYKTFLDITTKKFFLDVFRDDHCGDSEKDRGIPRGTTSPHIRLPVITIYLQCFCQQKCTIPPIFRYFVHKKGG